MARFINPAAARELAYLWHGGMWSPLYAFASSGLVADQLVLLYEIRQCEALPYLSKTDSRQLRGLYRFAQSCLARIPGKYPFAAPWARLN